MRWLFRMCLVLSAFCRVGAGEVELTYEIFSLPLREATALARENRGGEAVYRGILKGVEEKKFRQEWLMVVNVASGLEVRVQEIEELIFPTEYDPPVLPSTQGGLGFTEPPLLPLPNLATSWETKHIGFFGEARTQDVEGRLLLKSAVGKTRFIKRDQIGRGVGMVEMPRFSVQYLQNGTFLKIEKPVLLGTMSPPRAEQGGKKKQVWFLFVMAREKA